MILLEARKTKLLFTRYGHFVSILRILRKTIMVFKVEQNFCPFESLHTDKDIEVSNVFASIG